MVNAPSTSSADATPNVADDRRRRKQVHAVGFFLGLFIGGIYFATLHPGVGRGDSAELQYAAALLGVCHSPGYAVETSVGNLFCRLPVGDGPALRMNVLMLLSGVTGGLALYGAVVRITKQILPGAVATSLLAFSSLYWTHSVLAEAYVFYGMFLTLSIYACVRAVESGRHRWLFAATLLLGVCVGDRISEALLLPAFLVLLLGYRRRFKWSAMKIAVMLGLFLLPFLYSVSFFLLRDDPARVYAREDAALVRILNGPSQSAKPSPAERFKAALLHCTGLRWKGKAEISGARMAADLDKLGWHLSGLGAFGDRYDIEDADTYALQMRQGSGASLGLLGCLLAACGVWHARKRGWWTFFALALFLGNMLFYLLHQPPDNLDFTIPGLIGLCLLAGFGVAGGDTIGVACPAVREKRRKIYQLICLAAPLFLLTTNYRFRNRNTVGERDRVEYCTRLAAAPLPPSSVIISQRNSGMVYRYLYHVVAERQDVAVINVAPEIWVRVMDYYARRGRPVFFHATPDSRPPIGKLVVPGDVIAPDFRRTCLKNTPLELSNLNFLRAPASW